MGNTIHAINLVQFVLGAFIATFNLLLLGALMTNNKLKTAGNFFLGNLCFANLVVGCILSVANAVDGTLFVANNTTQSGLSSPLLKTEGTLAIVNCFVNVAMILALITNKFIMIRTPQYRMSSTTCCRIAVAIWALVLLLLLIKAVVSALHFMDVQASCFHCYMVFEITTLVIFTFATVVFYGIAQFLIVVHKTRTVQDGSRPNRSVDYAKEYAVTITVGIVLAVFVMCFIFFLILDTAWLQEGSATLLNADVAEVLITIFFFHCFINPLVCCIRDRDLGQSAFRLALCRRITPGQDEEQLHAEPNDPAAMNNGDGFVLQQRPLPVPNYEDQDERRNREPRGVQSPIEGTGTWLPPLPSYQNAEVIANNNSAAVIDLNSQHLQEGPTPV